MTLNLLSIMMPPEFTYCEKYSLSLEKSQGDYSSPIENKSTVHPLTRTGSPQSTEQEVKQWDMSDEAVARLKASWGTKGLANRIERFLRGKRGQLVKHRDDRAVWEEIINGANAKGALSIISKLRLSPIKAVEDYQDDQAAIEALKRGELCLQMPLAGAGSRMESSLDKLGIKLPKKESYRLANLDIWRIAEAMGLVKKENFPKYAMKLSIGEREFLALEQGILDLKKPPYNLSAEEIARISGNMKIIVSVSDEIKKRTHRMFAHPSKISGRPFFGFNPDNIVFVAGGYGVGFEINKNGKVVPTARKDKQRVSYNHGYAFMELVWIKGPEAYLLSVKGKKRNLPKPVFEYVYEKGARIGCIRRINDLILLHPRTALDAEMFGAYLSIRKENPAINVFFELMANPTKEKGGFPLALDEEELKLLETLATKDKKGKIERKLDKFAQEELARTKGRRGVAHNRLYGFYQIYDMARALTEKEMPLSISQDKAAAGIISPEIPTGDITWLKGVRAAAGQRRRDLFIEEGILPNEQRDKNNEAILDENGRPKQAYSPENGGTGIILHNIKEAKEIKDGLRVVDYLDNPENKIFDRNYYKRRSRYTVGAKPCFRPDKTSSPLKGEKQNDSWHVIIVEKSGVIGDWVKTAGNIEIPASAIEHSAEKITVCSKDEQASNTAASYRKLQEAIISGNASPEDIFSLARSIGIYSSAKDKSPKNIDSGKEEPRPEIILPGAEDVNTYALNEAEQFLRGNLSWLRGLRSADSKRDGETYLYAVMERYLAFLQDNKKKQGVEIAAESPKETAAYKYVRNVAQDKPGTKNIPQDADGKMVYKLAEEISGLLKEEKLYDIWTDEERLILINMLWKIFEQTTPAEQFVDYIITFLTEQVNALVSAKSYMYASLNEKGLKKPNAVLAKKSFWGIYADKRVKIERIAAILRQIKERDKDSALRLIKILESLVPFIEIRQFGFINEWVKKAGDSRVEERYKVIEPLIFPELSRNILPDEAVEKFGIELEKTVRDEKRTDVCENNSPDVAAVVDFLMRETTTHCKTQHVHIDRGSEEIEDLQKLNMFLAAGFLDGYLCALGVPEGTLIADEDMVERYILSTGARLNFRDITAKHQRMINFSQDKPTIEYKFFVPFLKLLPVVDRDMVRVFLLDILNVCGALKKCIMQSEVREELLGLPVVLSSAEQNINYAHLEKILPIIFRDSPDSARRSFQRLLLMTSRKTIPALVTEEPERKKRDFAQEIEQYYKRRGWNLIYQLHKNAEDGISSDVDGQVRRITAEVEQQKRDHKHYHDVILYRFTYLSDMDHLAGEDWSGRQLPQDDLRQWLKKIDADEYIHALDILGSLPDCLKDIFVLGCIPAVREAVKTKDGFGRVLNGVKNILVSLPVKAKKFYVLSFPMCLWGYPFIFGLGLLGLGTAVACGEALPAIIKSIIAGGFSWLYMPVDCHKSSAILLWGLRLLGFGEVIFIFVKCCFDPLELKCCKKWLTSKNSRLRIIAANGLASLGHKAKAQVLSLKEALKKEADVRAAAAMTMALYNIVDTDRVEDEYYQVLKYWVENDSPILNSASSSTKKTGADPNIRQTQIDEVGILRSDPIEGLRSKDYVSSGIKKARGLLFWPKYKFEFGRPLPAGIINPTRSAADVLRILAEAGAKGIELSITGHLRGIDMCGSSLDLPEFQRRFTAPAARQIKDIPSTPTIASEFTTKVRFELSRNPDVIEYVAEDYGIIEDHPYIVTEPIKLTAPGRTPYGQKDAAAYIFMNIFGLRGIKIICESISPMALAGGMESSNVFNVALLAAASMLSGAGLSLADIFSLAVKLENDELGGLTGGQGHICCMTGGAWRHFWLSGIKDAEGRMNNPYAAFSIQLLSDEQLPLVEEHFALTQAGKDYENGKAAAGRTAALNNNMWTDLLRDNDPQALPLLWEYMVLTDEYTAALQREDFETVVRCVRRYVEIRDILCRRWLTLTLDAREEKDAPEYARKYARKVFDPAHPQYQDYQVVRDMYAEYGETLRAVSPYTLEPIAGVVQAQGTKIADMPLGAGGPGANVGTVSVEGSKQLNAFFKSQELPSLTEEAARKIIRGQGRGTLRGYMPFKAGKEGLQIKGFAESGFALPAEPQQVVYDEKTGEFTKTKKEFSSSPLKGEKQADFRYVIIVEKSGVIRAWVKTAGNIEIPASAIEHSVEKITLYQVLQYWVENNSPILNSAKMGSDLNIRRLFFSSSVCLMLRSDPIDTMSLLKKLNSSSPITLFEIMRAKEDLIRLQQDYNYLSRIKTGCSDLPSQMLGKAWREGHFMTIEVLNKIVKGAQPGASGSSLKKALSQEIKEQKRRIKTLHQAKLSELKSSIAVRQRHLNNLANTIRELCNQQGNVSENQRGTLTTQIRLKEKLLNLVQKDMQKLEETCNLIEIEPWEKGSSPIEEKSTVLLLAQQKKTAEIRTLIEKVVFQGDFKSQETIENISGVSPSEIVHFLKYINLCEWHCQEIIEQAAYFFQRDSDLTRAIRIGKNMCTVYGYFPEFIQRMVFDYLHYGIPIEDLRDFVNYSNNPEESLHFLQKYLGSSIVNLVTRYKEKGYININDFQEELFCYKEKIGLTVKLTDKYEKTDTEICELVISVNKRDLELEGQLNTESRIGSEYENHWQWMCKEYPMLHGFGKDITEVFLELVTEPYRNSEILHKLQRGMDEWAGVHRSVDRFDRGAGLDFVSDEDVKIIVLLAHLFEIAEVVKEPAIGSGLCYKGMLGWHDYFLHHKNRDLFHSTDWDCRCNPNLYKMLMDYAAIMPLEWEKRKEEIKRLLRRSRRYLSVYELLTRHMSNNQLEDIGVHVLSSMRMYLGRDIVWSFAEYRNVVLAKKVQREGYDINISITQKDGRKKIEIEVKDEELKEILENYKKLQALGELINEGKRDREELTARTGASDKQIEVMCQVLDENRMISSEGNLEETLISIKKHSKRDAILSFIPTYQYIALIHLRDIVGRNRDSEMGRILEAMNCELTNRLLGAEKNSLWQYRHDKVLMQIRMAELRGSLPEECTKEDLELFAAEEILGKQGGSCSSPVSGERGQTPLPVGCRVKTSCTETVDTSDDRCPGIAAIGKGDCSPAVFVQYSFGNFASSGLLIKPAEVGFTIQYWIAYAGRAPPDVSNSIQIAQQDCYTGALRVRQDLSVRNILSHDPRYP
ncbi:MAG: hypothetical protein V1662_02235, partial [Candidatus Omnitrophota bacterium]